MECLDKRSLKKDLLRTHTWCNGNVVVFMHKVLIPMHIHLLVLHFPSAKLHAVFLLVRNWISIGGHHDHTTIIISINASINNCSL